MCEYEIRILKSPGSPTLIMVGTQLGDFTAVRLARKMARGRQFEVWRDLDCITGMARLPRLRIVVANEAA
jgi:hypothetical protein